MLVDRGAELTVIACADEELLASEFTSHAIALTPHDTCSSFASTLIERPDLVSTLPDWTVWCRDMDLLRVGRSDLPRETRLRVLPVRTEAGLGILGSKVGLARFAAALGLRQPEFAIADNADDLDHTLREFDGPCVVKGERGAGGERVVLVEDAGANLTGELPAAWYPLLVQRFHPGTPIGVDALFVEGRLAGLLQGTVVSTVSPFGPACTRHFTPTDETVIATLAHLGAAAGLHGFANCSFVPSGRGPLLIEADMRPNVWHQFGPALGVDWLRLMQDPPPRPATPQLDCAGRTIHVYPRAIVHALRSRSWPDLRPWLLRAPGTWRTRVRGEPTLDRAERQDIAREVTRLPHRLVSRLSRAVPSPGRVPPLP